MSTKKVLLHVDKNMNVLVKDLRILIQQPSVSAKNQGIKKCANLVRSTLKKSGISARNFDYERLSTNRIWRGEIKEKSKQDFVIL